MDMLFGLRLLTRLLTAILWGICHVENTERRHPRGKN